MTSLSETSMLAGSSGVTSGYTIDQSIRLSGADTTGFNITPSGAGNTDKWTFSCWVKRGVTGVIKNIIRNAKTKLDPLHKFLEREVNALVTNEV